MSKSSLNCIKHAISTDVNNNTVYQVNEILGVTNIIGSGSLLATRGPFKFIQATGKLA